MKTLFNYFDRSSTYSNSVYETISDDSIWYKKGILNLNWMMPNQAKNVISRYNIQKSNPRPGVIKYMKDQNPPLPKDSEEMFPRNTWDLESLIGETEQQLMHKVYYDAANYVLKNTKRQHDILAIFQCSAKKPYYDHLRNKTEYYIPYKDYVDFACISNPGIIPIYMSQYYPYMYDEWNIPAEEKLDEIIDMTKKYRIVNMCRLIRFVRKMGYKKVMVLINNRFKQWIFDEMYDKNIAGAREWMHIVTNDSLRTNLSKKYPQLVKSHLLDVRTQGLGLTRKRFGTVLKSLVDAADKDDVDTIMKKRLGQIKESEASGYRIKTSVDWQDFLKKFKNSIGDNMANSKIDKGSNNLYYKSYYWSALDLLLLALDGDLVEDIDGEYWKLMKKLKNDKDFDNFGDFLFSYKPLLKVDGVEKDTLEAEAYEMGILRHKPKIKLKSSLFD